MESEWNLMESISDWFAIDLLQKYFLLLLMRSNQIERKKGLKWQTKYLQFYIVFIRQSKKAKQCCGYYAIEAKSFAFCIAIYFVVLDCAVYTFIYLFIYFREKIFVLVVFSFFRSANNNNNNMYDGKFKKIKHPTYITQT